MWKAKLAAGVIVAVSLVIVSAGSLSVLWFYGGRPTTARLMDRPAPAAPRRASVPVAARYVGVFADGEPASYGAVQSFQAVEGHAPDITLYYSNWGEAFRARFVAVAARSGAEVVIQMGPGPYSMQEIAAGRGDGYLRSFATQVRRYRGPVILSFAAEPDTKAHPWGWQRTPAAAWVAAWRHVVNLFRGAGAYNARWLWDMGGGMYAAARVHRYWPGDRYVDWVGINAYFISPAKTYQYVVGSMVRAIRKFTGKPIILPEVGIGPVAGQAAKLPALFAGIRSDHLLGLIWFNQAQHGDINHQDWRLSSHSAAAAEFRAGVRSLGALAP